MSVTQMIPIKIQCGCGQRYAFDVEPVAGRMPAPIACPACGGDGTPAANAILAQRLPAQPVAVVATPAPAPPPPATAPTILRTAAPATLSVHRPAATASSAPRTVEPRSDRSQAEADARAKISWGDPPEEVVKFLMIQGFGYEEANSIVNAMFKERAKAVRGKGIKKVFIGIAFLCVPVVGLVLFLIGWPIQLFAVTIMIGLWGLWILIKGIIMFVAPKSEPGDVASPTVG